MNTHFEYFSQEHNASNHEYGFINVNYTQNWSDNFETVFTAAYQRYIWHLFTQLTPAGALAGISNPASTDPLVIDFAIGEVEPLLRLHNHLTWDDVHDIHFGVEFRRPELVKSKARNNFDMRDLANGVIPIRYYGELLETTPTNDEDGRTITGLYGQYQVSPWDRLTLTLGVRHDRYSDVGTSTNPRAGIVYQATDQTTLKLLYGEAFRAPARNELTLKNNPAIIGNPGLRPEKARTWEAALLHQFDRMSVALTYFDTLITDSIAQGIKPGTVNTRTFVNGADETGRGFELEAIADVTQNIQLRGSVSHFMDKPDSSFRESQNLASLIVNVHGDKWNFNIGGYFQDEKQFVSNASPDRLTLDSFIVVNTKLQYSILSNTTVFGQINNLFDEDYLTPPLGAINPIGIPNRGRELLIGVNHRF